MAGEEDRLVPTCKNVQILGRRLVDFRRAVNVHGDRPIQRIFGYKINRAVDLSVMRDVDRDRQSLYITLKRRGYP